MLDLEIRAIADMRDLKQLRVFLLSQALWYPNYEHWVDDVCIPDVDHGHKTAIVAYSDGKVVGDAVFQPHKELPRTREFKNMRINPDFRRRDLGHFLLRQVEEENKGTFDRIVLDVDARQRTVVQFFQFCGYQPIMQMPLYSQHNLDIIMAKEFPAKDIYSLPAPR